MTFKFFYLLPLLLCIGLALPCADGQDCNLPSAQQLTPQNVYPFIDYQLKAEYWQYLRAAKLLYRANVDQSDKFLFLSIYRNIVGTFLTITTWVKGETKVQVNTLVRLGDGAQDNSGANYGPIDIQPITLSFKLGTGQYFVDTNEKGELQINGKVVGDQSSGTTQVSSSGDAQKLGSKCALLDSWIRQNNWQYLRNAQNVHRSGRISNERYYCVYNYVNIVGTFFVLASEGIKDGDHYIGTFVRLGDGYQTGSQALYTPVDFIPVVLDFELLKK